MSAEIWDLVKNDDWSLVSEVVFQSWWPTRLWNFTKHYQFIGGHGAYGVGYGAPAAVGAALARPSYGRLTINIQSDGDPELRARRPLDGRSSPHPDADGDAQQPLLPPGADVRRRHGRERAERDVCARWHRQRDLTDPNIDYASLAKAYGMCRDRADRARRPILGPPSKKALDVVRRGEPALVDVEVSQPR